MENEELTATQKNIIRIAAAIYIAALAYLALSI